MHPDHADRGSWLQLDPRFENAISLIRDGTFGWADIFESLVESITSGGDYYLLANDFPAYVDCQVQPCCMMIEKLEISYWW